MKKFKLEDLPRTKPFLSLLLGFIPFSLAIHFLELAFGKTTMELFLFGAKLKGYESSGATSVFEMFPVGFYFTLALLVLGLFLKKRVLLWINISALFMLGILFYNLWTSDLLFVVNGLLVALMGGLFGVVQLVVWSEISSSNDSLGSES